MTRKFVVLFAAASLALAAQIVSYTKTDAQGNKLWSYDDGVFAFNSAYVWTDFAARIDYKASGSAERSSVKMTDLVEFGYYRIEDGAAGEAMPMFVRDETSEMAIRNSVIFNGGDRIGIYAKIQSTETTKGHYEVTVDGKTYTSDKQEIKVNGKKYHGTWVPGETTTSTKTWTTTANAIDGAYKNVNNVDHDSLHDETQYFCLFLDRFSLKDHFEYYMKGMVAGEDYDQFIVDVIDQNTGSDGQPITVITDGSTGEPVTTGQPLPGVMASVVLGGAAVAAFRRRRS